MAGIVGRELEIVDVTSHSHRGFAWFYGLHDVSSSSPSGIGNHVIDTTPTMQGIKEVPKLLILVAYLQEN